MTQLTPYRPLAPEVERALERLEQSDTFDAQAFAVVNQERWRRIPIMLGFMLPAAGVGALIVWLADSAGWLGGFAMPLYAFFPILFAGLALQPLRRESLADEMRLGRAIGRWEERGGRIREKPLE